MLIVLCLVKSSFPCLLIVSSQSTNSDSMSLISISIVLFLQTLFLLFFFSCIIATHTPFPLWTLFFLTCVNMPHMYQYSLSLIFKLFLSYSFFLSFQSLNLIITTNSSETSTPTLNPSYELSCIFDSLSLHLVFTHLVHPWDSNSKTMLCLSTPHCGTSRT